MVTKAQFLGAFFIGVISIFAFQLAIENKSSGGLEEPNDRTRTVISSRRSFNLFSVNVKHSLESWVKSEAVGADGKVGRLEVVLEKNSTLEHKENKNCHLDVIDSVLKVEGNKNVYFAGVKNHLEVLNNVEGVIAGDGNSGEISGNRGLRMELNEMKEIKIIGNVNTQIQTNGGRIIAENNTNLIISGSDHNLEVRGTRNLQIRKSLDGLNRIVVKSGTPIAVMDLKTQADRDGAYSRYQENRNQISKEESWVDIDGFSKSWVEAVGIEVEYVNSANSYSINGTSFVIGGIAFTLTPVDHDTHDIVLVKLNQNLTVISSTSYAYIGIEGLDETLVLEGPKVRVSYKNPKEIRIIL